MRTFLPTALMALLLSNLALAGVETSTVTVQACETTTSTQTILVPQLESTSGSAPAPVVVISTVTLIPMSANPASGIFHPSFPTGKGIPSGVFWSGYATGSEHARPTVYPKCGNRTGNHTHHHHHPTASINTNTTLTKIPFFTLTNTESILLPTLPPITPPELTLTNTVSLPLNSISTDCPDMSSTGPQVYSTAVPTTKMFDTIDRLRRRRYW
jgi:hypothetical protein